MKLTMQLFNNNTRKDPCTHTHSYHRSNNRSSYLGKTGNATERRAVWEPKESTIVGELSQMIRFTERTREMPINISNKNMF